MSGSLHTKVNKPCCCGHNRWKTKGDRAYALITDYQCRMCGNFRSITLKQVEEGE